VDEFKLTIVACNGKLGTEVKDQESLSPSSSAADGLWHLVAVTWSSIGTIRHYLDGSLILDKFAWAGSLRSTGCLVVGQVRRAAVT
jgi:hypothetical protein